MTRRVMGGGSSSAAQINLAGDVTGTDAATVVSAISGATPIVVTPVTIAWKESTATPTLTQNIATTANGGALMTLKAQSAKVGGAGAGGALKLQSGAGDGAGVAGSVQVFVGGVQAFSLDILGAGTLPCIVPGALATSFGNLAFMGTNDGSGTYMNAKTGSDHIQINGTDFFLVDVNKCTVVNALKFGYASTASGGGATLPLFSVGIGQASQPTTQAQNGWIQCLDSTGATIWIPIWK